DARSQRQILPVQPLAQQAEFDLLRLQPLLQTQQRVVDLVLRPADAAQGSQCKSQREGGSHDAKFPGGPSRRVAQLSPRTFVRSVPPLPSAIQDQSVQS